MNDLIWSLRSPGYIKIIMIKTRREIGTRLRRALNLGGDGVGGGRQVKG